MELEDPPVTILISKSLMQICYTSNTDKDLWKTLFFLDKIFPNLHQNLRYVSTIREEALRMKRKIINQQYAMVLLREERDNVNTLIMQLITENGYATQQTQKSIQKFLDKYVQMQRKTDEKLEKPLS